MPAFMAMRRAMRSVAAVSADVHHFPVRMEGREMQRHVGPEALHHPGALRLEFGVGVVLAGNQQGRDLEPDLRLVLEVLERVEHRIELPAQSFL